MEQKALVISDKIVRKYLTVEDVIDVCEKTWRWYGEGKVVMPNKITTDMSTQGVAGWFNSMPAYIAPMDTASSLKPKLRNTFEKTTSPMITAARPMTIAPRPMPTSAKP